MLSAKWGDIRRLDQPVLDGLRCAGDGGQRRFQLVGDIGGEFPPQRLAGFLFRHIQQDQHCAADLAVLPDGIGQQMVDPVAEGDGLFAVPALQGGIGLRDGIPRCGLKTGHSCAAHPRGV